LHLDDPDRRDWLDVRIERVPVNRHSTRSTLLGAIPGEGSRLTPGLVISLETLETGLFESGLTPEGVV
jgi:hypothetical protein